MAKKPYVTLERLSHDGVDVLPGQDVEIEEGRAVSLLRDGVIIDQATHKARQKAAAAQKAATDDATKKAEADAAAKQAADEEAERLAAEDEAAKIAAEEEAARLAAEAGEGTK